MQAAITCEISANRKVAKDTYLLKLAGDETTLTMPGQFVNLKIPGLFLRRPISVCDTRPGQIVLLYKTVGAGTRALAQLEPGEKLEVLSGLGRGFKVPADSKLRPVLVGGGIGIAPLLGLARHLTQHGITPQAVFGFRSAAEIALVTEMAELGVNVRVATEDGSAGTAGFVTQLLHDLLTGEDEGAGLLAGKDEGTPAAANDFCPTPNCPPPNYLYACGPMPMMKALYRLSLPGQFSLEERMGCGIGACMGCVHPTQNGLQRVCKEGPVFTREELAW